MAIKICSRYEIWVVDKPKFIYSDSSIKAEQGKMSVKVLMIGSLIFRKLAENVMECTNSSIIPRRWKPELKRLLKVRVDLSNIHCLFLS